MYDAQITNGSIYQSTDLDDDSCEELSNQNQSESQSDREEAPLTLSKKVRAMQLPSVTTVLL